LRGFLYSRECAFAQRRNPPRRMRAPRRNNFAIASKRAGTGRRSRVIGPDGSGALANNPSSPGTFPADIRSKFCATALPVTHWRPNGTTRYRRGESRCWQPTGLRRSHMRLVCRRKCSRGGRRERSSGCLLESTSAPALRGGTLSVLQSFRLSGPLRRTGGGLPRAGSKAGVKSGGECYLSATSINIGPRPVEGAT
jgi:hypothetical protein